jgi:hypothetical protein
VLRVQREGTRFRRSYKQILILPQSSTTGVLLDARTITSKQRSPSLSSVKKALIALTGLSFPMKSSKPSGNSGTFCGHRFQPPDWPRCTCKTGKKNSRVFSFECLNYEYSMMNHCTLVLQIGQVFCSPSPKVREPVWPKALHQPAYAKFSPVAFT